MHTKRVIKNIFTYSFGAVMMRGLTALTAFFTLKTITPQEYGLLALINSFVVFMPIALGFGLRQWLNIEYFHLTEQQRKEVITELIATYLVLAPLCLFAMGCCTPYINSWFFAGHITTAMLTLIYTLCFLTFFVELIIQLLRVRQQAAVLVKAQALAGIATICITLTSVWYLGWGIYGFLVGQLVNTCFMIIWGGAVLVEQYVHSSFKQPRRIAYYIRRGVPFIPGLVSAWLLSLGNRWILAAHAPLHEVGIYALADSFGQLFQIVVIYAIYSAYVPYLLEKFANDRANIIEHDAANRRLMYMSMAFCAVMVIGGFALGKSILIWLLPPSYHAALPYIVGLVLSNVIVMGSYFATCYLQFAKKTGTLIGLTMMNAGINFGTALLLTPTLGITGIVIAQLLGNGIQFICTNFATAHNKKKSFV